MTETVLDRYQQEYMAYHRISTDRQRVALRVLREFDATLDEELTDATGADLQAFAGTQVEQYHVNTVRKHLNMIRPFFSWCYAVKLITAEQYMDLRQVKNPRGSSGKTKPKPYTMQELQGFWRRLEILWPLLPAKGRGSQALTRWLKGEGGWGRVWRHAMRLQIEALAHLALDLGLRRNEIFSLELNDLHYDNEYIVIMGKADPHTGDPKVRSVPYTKAAREAVKTWLEFRALMRPGHERPWLSCWYDVGFVTDAATQPMSWTRFKMLLQHTVGAEWKWHRFRHTCATEWLRAGLELVYVQELMGHATVEQTRCYAEILKTDLTRNLGAVEEGFAKATQRRAA